MRRLRLWAPTYAFLVFALALLVAISWAGLSFRGGLVGGGLYALALQVVASLFLVVSILDLRNPGLVDRPPSRGLARDRRPAERKAETGFDIRRAIWRFYSGHPVPAFLLSLGASITLTAVAMGLLDRTQGGAFDYFWVTPDLALKPSEVALGLTLGIVAIRLVRLGAWGVYGVILGFSAGAVLSQALLATDVDVRLTVLGWTAFAAALIVVAAVGDGTRYLRARSGEAARP